MRVLGSGCGEERGLLVPKRILLIGKALYFSDLA